MKCFIISSVTTKSAITPSFKGLIAEIFPGQPIELVIERNHETLNITVTAGERPTLGLE